MKLSTGKVAFPIEFDNGDKDCIYFNPSDPDLASRFSVAKERISQRMEQAKIDKMTLGNDGVPVVESMDDIMNLPDDEMDAVIDRAKNTVKIFEDAKAIVCDELNVAFGSDVSSVVFKHCSPFAVVDGEYYVLQFLRAITPEIQKNLKKSTEETEKKMAKHVNKYVNR